MVINTPNDIRRASPDDHLRDDLRPPVPLDAELPLDPETADSPASGGRVMVYAVAIAALLGAMFYGLNTNSDPTTAADPRSATAASDSRPTTPPNIRDVTPNRGAGTTTGAAPAQPTAPQARPTSPQVDQAESPTSR